MRHLFTLLLLLSPLFLSAQTITGNVVNAHTGDPVVGATVKLLGIDKGTATDADGKFALDGAGTLQVSSVGFSLQHHGQPLADRCRNRAVNRNPSSGGT